MNRSRGRCDNDGIRIVERKQPHWFRSVELDFLERETSENLAMYFLSMARVHFQLRSDRDPDGVLAALTDFSSRRAEAWPNIDSAYFQVHAEGPRWAEVTEGSGIAGGVWERSSYTWDPGVRTLAVETLESNVWGPGSRWDYRLTLASGGGSLVEVTVVRNGKGLKGRLLALAISLAGTRILRSQLGRALAAIPPRPSA